MVSVQYSEIFSTNDLYPALKSLLDELFGQDESCDHTVSSIANSWVMQLQEDTSLPNGDDQVQEILVISKVETDREAG